MKKCRWNIQRPVWAFLVILCCHGNFADDPLPSFTGLPDDFTQRQTQKTIPIGGLTDSPVKTDDFVIVTTIKSVAPAAPLQGDASIFDGKKPALTNSLNQPSTGVRIGDEDNTSAPPADALRKDADQLVSSSKTMDGNPEKRAAPERSNPLLMEGVVPHLLPPIHVKDAQSQNDKQDVLGVQGYLPPQDEIPLPEKPSESERTKIPDTGKESRTIKKDAATVDQQKLDSEVPSDSDKEPKVPKNEGDNAAPVKQQQPTQAPPQYPLDDSGTPVTEDMPSFSEWSKKRLEEQVKQGSNPPPAASQQNKAPSKQMRHKNYASVDCGAKVINANPEAQSTGAVLSHFRDDYMLNPCTAKIWLIIELCESIQADRIDLANFELFSSSPREFSVYSSDRYPTREWTFLGTFEATDERTVQNFGFGHTSFGKYIKVEMVSHYGSEHFCPLSLVRVFGTSEYEALETEESADSHGRGIADEDDEEVSGRDHLSSHESQNLFGSAKDVVMNIVKKVLRSDKSDSASSTGGKVEQSSSSENNSCSGSQNCICLQRLPDVDCGGTKDENQMAADASCPKDAAIAHLHCHYPELLTFLLQGWPGTFHGRLLEQCFSTCVPHIEECGRDTADFSRLGRASAAVHPTCRFYGAILSTVSFGALCHLDKLLLDEHSRLPVAVPRCPSANLTSNLTAPSLDLLLVPAVTPTALFETASSLVGFAKSAVSSGDSYQCDSSDHIAVCSTNLDSPVLGAPLSPASESRGTDSIPVIHTGAIMTEEHPDAGSQPASSSSSFQSQILPTRTLPGDTESSLKSKAVQNAKAPCVSGSELGSSSPKSDDVSKESSVELPPASSLDPATISTLSKAKAVPTSRETKSSPMASKSNDVASSGSDVKPDGSKVPKEQLASVAIEQPVDATAAVQSPQDASVAKEAPTSAAQQGAELDSDAAILEQEQAAFEEGTSTAIPAPGQQNGDGVAGVSNGKPQNNGFLNGGIVAPGQKESVFVRLSNRIKALELNMSLSGQYLEELSRRYRKQMEEMQKAFNKTIGALNETARSAYERDVKQQEVILHLQSQLDSMYKMVLNLQEEQDGIHTTVVTRHILLMVVEACVMGALFMACARSGQKQKVRNGRAVSVVHPNTSAASKRSFDDDGRRKRNSSADTLHRRRNSDSSAVGRHCAGASNGLDMRDRRRPSTEALNVSGSYSDLMILEPTIPVWTAGPPLKEQEHSRKKKKHKNKQGKQELYRSVSNNVLLYNSNSQKPPPAPPKNLLSRKNSGTGMSSAGLLFAATTKSAATSRVQELTRKDKFPEYCSGGGTQCNFTNLFSGYYGGCPPPQFPPKLAMANGGLKKAAVEKVCG